MGAHILRGLPLFPGLVKRIQAFQGRTMLGRQFRLSAVHLFKHQSSVCCAGSEKLTKESNSHRSFNRLSMIASRRFSLRRNAKPVDSSLVWEVRKGKAWRMQSRLLTRRRQGENIEHESWRESLVCEKGQRVIARLQRALSLLPSCRLS